MKSDQTYYSKVVFGRAHNQRAAMAYGVLCYLSDYILEVAKLSGQVGKLGDNRQED